jgi:glycine cleavage system H protein
MNIKYSEEHEWITVDGDIATCGISNFAQEQLGDVVFVEMPEVGRNIDKGEEVGVVESVKAASEIFTPVGGEVVETNDDLTDAPETVNADPEGDGWMFKIRLSDPSELDEMMDPAAYAKFVEDAG